MADTSTLPSLPARAAASAKEIKRQDAMEREARFRLANAAVLWLWHEENPAATGREDGRP